MGGNGSVNISAAEQWGIRSEIKLWLCWSVLILDPPLDNFCCDFVFYCSDTVFANKKRDEAINCEGNSGEME